MSSRVVLRRRSVAQQRDLYQMKLVWAVAALQQIKWHINCDKAEFANLKQMVNPTVLPPCPACLAERALTEIAGQGPYIHDFSLSRDPKKPTPPPSYKITERRSRGRAMLGDMPVRYVED